MTDKNIKDYCKNCDVEPPAMKFKCPECEHNPDKEQIFLKDINETGFYCAVDDTERLYLYEVINNTNKEWLKKDSQAKLLIDEWIYDYTDYDDRKVYFTSGNLEATYNNTSTGKVYKIEDTKFKIYGNYGQFLVEDKLTYKEQLARKTQECEKLEDFRTLTRGVFTFGDSDVDDENFIKYLQEYSRSYEEAIDGYYRLTDITGIDYTVHGGADIEEIIKRVDILKQECEELKEKYEALKLENQEGYELVAELKQECEELKEKYDEIKEDRYNLNMEMYTLDRYRKALEEIEEYIKKYECDNCEDFAFGCGDCGTPRDILDIISRAKGEE